MLLRLMLLLVTVAPGQIPSAAVGTLSGRVMTEEPTPAPIAGAVVTVVMVVMVVMPNGRTSSVAASTLSDDRGMFSFANLPPGRYRVAASRAAYVAAQVSVTAMPAQAMAAVELRLSRAGVLSGRIADDTGAAVENCGAFVYALRATMRNGRRTFDKAGTRMSGDCVDDRGVYRIYALPPGEYIVAAIPGLGTASARELPPEDIQEADRALRDPAYVPASSASRRVIGWAPMFFPGVTSADAATPITLASGEERHGVNLAFQPVPMTTIQGVVTMPEGWSAASAQINMLPARPGAPVWGTGINSSIGGYGTARAGADGRFTLTGVAPNDYVFAARATNGTASAWAIATVTVNGELTLPVALTLVPTGVITGTLQFDEAGLPAETLGRIRVLVTLADPQAPPVAAVAPGIVSPDGTFTLSGVTPGRYRLSVTGLPPGWALSTARTGDTEAIDTGLEVSSAQAKAPLALVATRRLARLTVVMRQVPAGGATVIIFPSSRELWTWQSRWIRSVEVDATGEFDVADLPPGAYHVAVRPGIGEEVDLAWLGALLAEATSVTLVANQTTRIEVNR